METKSSQILGINGLGRIGKLSLWHHLGRRYFKEIVINTGRMVGMGIDDIVHYIERDSTYGLLNSYLHGHRAGSIISDIDKTKSSFKIDGIPIRVLTRDRNPKDIKWADNGVKLVVDTTGQFIDPCQDPDHPRGALRGHLRAGASKVIVSAPFKLKENDAMPDDAVTTVMGINGDSFDPVRHRVISNASCTTTCLSHMIKPLLDYFGSESILSASMATIHACTGSQAVLDRLPQEDAKDLRKNRSIMNNIILTTTGAAKALRLVLPEMARIGFIAESVRIPTVTGSLVILVMNFQEDFQKDPIRRGLINRIYKNAAMENSNGYLLYTEKQNVSSDIIGQPYAAAVIEGHETHTRTGTININLEQVTGIDKHIMEMIKNQVASIQVTQAVIYAWYDNEMGSYVNILGDRTASIAEFME